MRVLIGSVIAALGVAGSVTAVGAASGTTCSIAPYSYGGYSALIFQGDKLAGSTTYEFHLTAPDGSVQTWTATTGDHQRALAFSGVPAGAGTYIGTVSVDGATAATCSVAV